MVILRHIISQLDQFGRRIFFFDFSQDQFWRMTEKQKVRVPESRIEKPKVCVEKSAFITPK